MTDSALLDLLEADRAIALVRLPAVADPAALVAALARGGIRAIEFAFTTPGVEEIIAAVVAGAPAGVLIGAGTVTDADLVRRAAAAGAQFLVTPGVSGEVAVAAQDARLPVVMGAMTPTEVMAAVGLGASAVKIFPADTMGPAYFRHLAGPLPHVPLVASGGIAEHNAADYVRAGALAVTAGSSVIGRADVESGDWSAVTTKARGFATAARAA